MKVLLLVILLSSNICFAFEVLDPETGILHPVRKCYPLGREYNDLKYISCSDVEQKYEKVFFGACSNNDKDSCEKLKGDALPTNQGRLMQPASILLPTAIDAIAAPKIPSGANTTKPASKK